MNWWPALVAAILSHFFSVLSQLQLGYSVKNGMVGFVTVARSRGRSLILVGLSCSNKMLGSRIFRCSGGLGRGWLD